LRFEEEPQQVVLVLMLVELQAELRWVLVVLVRMLVG